ncbi:hypothetical protein N7541_011000 [Penicillium brevicompactum]|uniref:Uncharacterized protein n=1 Tax=Penicillium brevicompactum TaxID=5074 RepID=A0A9W9QPN7_PENBR|nr:hypothetical protein N7541_011000 [Penicillium brevicompactum]
MSSSQMRPGVSQTVENRLTDFPYASNANGVRPPPGLLNLRAPRSSPARFESSARISPVIPLARGVKVVGPSCVAPTLRAVSMQPLGQAMDVNVVHGKSYLFESREESNRRSSTYLVCELSNMDYLTNTSALRDPRAQTQHHDHRFPPGRDGFGGVQETLGQARPALLQASDGTLFERIVTDGSSGSAFQFRDLNRTHDFGDEARASQFMTARSRAASYQPVVPRAVVRPRQSAATSLSPGQHFASVNQGRSSINQRAFDPIPEEVLSGLTMGESYAFNAKMLGQHLASRGPPPGLPVPDELVRPRFRGNVLQIDEHLGSGGNSLVVRVEGEQSTSQRSYMPGSAASPDAFSDERFCRPVAQGSRSGSDTRSPRMPVFGFSSTLEAESFEPAPRRHPHGLPYVEDQSSQSPDQGLGYLTSSRRPIRFGFSSTAEAMSHGLEVETHAASAPFGAHQVKAEPAMQARLPVYQAVDGNFEQNHASQVWSNFAPHSAAISDIKGPPGFGDSFDSFNQGSAHHDGGPPNRLESNETPALATHARAKDLSGGNQSKLPAGPPHQQYLKSLDLKALKSQQVIFIFHMLSIMGNLRPEFVLQRGGKGKGKIGIKIIMWGHTVFGPNSFESVAMAKVAACRLALALIQEDNPTWLVPPQPSDGPTIPAWDWNWMLADYCATRAIPQPLYQPSRYGDFWHCDLSVKDNVFRTAEGCRSLAEAHNTVAHISLYQLIVMDDDEPFLHSNCNLPMRGLKEPLSVDLQKQIAGLLRSGKTCKRPKSGEPKSGSSKSGASNSQYAGVTKKTSPAGKFRGWGGKKKRSKGKGKQQQAQPPRAKKKSAAQSAAQSATQAATQSATQSASQPASGPPLGVARSANTEPVTNSRLAPIEVAEEHVDDPLATLKAIEKKFKDLNSDASFRRVMERICDVLGVNYPTIITRDNDDNDYPHSLEVLAEFDDSHPYLGRASPIKLADVENSDKEVINGIAVKHIILRLLRMVKEDSGADDDEYHRDYPKLSDFEHETKESLARQSRPSGTLSY